MRCDVRMTTAPPELGLAQGAERTGEIGAVFGLHAEGCSDELLHENGVRLSK